MSSCKPLSSKIFFGNGFQGSTTDSVKIHFLLFLLNKKEVGSTNLLVVPPNSTAGRDIKGPTSIHTLNAIIISCPGNLFSTAVSFWFRVSALLVWLVFSILFGKGIQKRGSQPGLALSKGIFCFLFLHRHVYFWLFFTCPNSVYKDFTLAIVGPWQCFITTYKLLLFTLPGSCRGQLTKITPCLKFVPA